MLEALLLLLPISTFILVWRGFVGHCKLLQPCARWQERWQTWCPTCCLSVRRFITDLLHPCHFYCINTDTQLVLLPVSQSLCVVIVFFTLLSVLAFYCGWSIGTCFHWRLSATQAYKTKCANVIDVGLKLWTIWIVSDTLVFLGFADWMAYLLIERQAWFSFLCLPKSLFHLWCRHMHS